MSLSEDAAPDELPKIHGAQIWVSINLSFVKSMLCSCAEHASAGGPLMRQPQTSTKSKEFCLSWQGGSWASSYQSMLRLCSLKLALLLFSPTSDLSESGMQMIGMTSPSDNCYHLLCAEVHSCLMCNVWSALLCPILTSNLIPPFVEQSCFPCQLPPPYMKALFSPVDKNMPVQQQISAPLTTLPICLNQLIAQLLMAGKTLDLILLPSVITPG